VDIEKRGHVTSSEAPENPFRALSARCGIVSPVLTSLRTRLAPAAAVLAALALTAACGSSSSSADGGHDGGHDITARPTPSTASPAGTVVRITIAGDNVDPAGSRVQVSKGTPVTLLISADKAGELHVHSTPEQHVEFPAGSSAATLTLDQPGVVEVEDHALDKLIVQLEVR
jgi:hypothetical protein